MPSDWLWSLILPGTRWRDVGWDWAQTSHVDLLVHSDCMWPTSRQPKHILCLIREAILSLCSNLRNFLQDLNGCRKGQKTHCTCTLEEEPEALDWSLVTVAAEVVFFFDWVAPLLPLSECPALIAVFPNTGFNLTLFSRSRKETTRLKVIEPPSWCKMRSASRDQRSWTWPGSLFTTNFKLDGKSNSLMPQEVDIALQFFRFVCIAVKWLSGVLCITECIKCFNSQCLYWALYQTNPMYNALLCRCIYFLLFRCVYCPIDTVRQLKSILISIARQTSTISLTRWETLSVSINHNLDIVLIYGLAEQRLQPILGWVSPSNSIKRLIVEKKNFLSVLIINRFPRNAIHGAFSMYVLFVYLTSPDQLANKYLSS